MATLWVTSASGELVQLQAGAYAAESELQHLIAATPQLIATAIGSRNPDAGWLLVRRELPISFDDAGEHTRWSLDHLFIDDEGVPTLVEVKRSSDPRARREVVAQMLDYAASFRADGRAERLRGWWEETVRARDGDPEAELEAFLDGTQFDDEAAFWAEVDTRISANRLRLVFVADRLSPSLVRIIEFLNEQMQHTEVLGVEVLPHTGPSLGGIVAYASTVRGQTTAVPATKGIGERLTEDAFAAVLRQHHGDTAVASALALARGAEEFGAFLSFGTDTRSPRVFLNFRTPGTGKVYWPLAVNPRPGKVALQLRWLAHQPTFADEGLRAEYLERMAEAAGVQFAAPRLDGFPGFHVSALTKAGVVDRVLDVLRWVKGAVADGAARSTG